MSELDDSNTDTALAGLRVLVTRPGEAGEALGRRVEEQGGEAVVFPVIDIAPPSDLAGLRAAMREFASGRSVDLAVFISAHAAEAVGAQLKRLGMKAPSTTRIAAVGPKTKAACAAAGIRVDFAPSARIDSEGLLDALCGYKAVGRRIMIFRGQAGRETLGWGLRSRGAEVREVDAYSRRLTRRPAGELIERWLGGGIDVVVVSSASVWDALADLLGAYRRDLLQATPALAYSERIAEHCRSYGAATIITASQPLDESALAALAEWRAA